ncbi:MAG: ABC transporter substrate-binding protein [Betaproteobacteria bacterium]|nr:ABC transporter substrate-binding protein [Betaproteobacteria bacterium]
MFNRRRLVITLGATALAAPFASLAPAQTAQPARIGLLGPGTASSNAAWVAELLARLRDLGYVEGRNFVLEPRWAEGKNDRLPELAAELVHLKVDVLVAFQTPSALAAKQATSTLPIIMGPAGDPVATGLVASLARPGGNVTGLSGATSDLAAKNLELIRDIVPSAKRVAILANARDPFTRVFLEQLEISARALGITLQTIMVQGDERLDAAYVEVANGRTAAVIVQPSLPQKRTVDLALQHRLLATSPAQGFADAGGVLSYAANVSDRFRDIAYYVDKILRGAKPADLPVRQPTKFELVINLKTAELIGLKIPRDVLARADRVIK